MYGYCKAKNGACSDLSTRKGTLVRSRFWLNKIDDPTHNTTPNGPARATRDNNEASRVSRAKYMYAHLKLHYPTLCPRYGAHVCPSIGSMYA